MEDLRILIVEDSRIYRTLLKEAIQKSFPEITIDEARDGRGALEKIDVFLPNLTFMDIRLPNENGLELAKKIKATHRNIGIVILTNDDTPEYRKAASQYGFDPFLVKGSFSSMELEKLLKSYLNTPAK